MKPRTILLAAFVVAFLVVGVPYWQTPYSQLSLPSSLWGPAMIVVALCAALPRIFGGGRFWPETLLVAASVPAVVLLRVIFDVLADSTSHNLWPVEVGIAACIGFLVALLGALGGRIVAYFLGIRPQHEPPDLASIGDRWVEHPLTHDGVAGTLRVRQLRDASPRRALALVTLAQADDVAAAGLPALTARIQQALERRGCLLVLVHRAGSRVHWYAYSATREAVDEAFASLKDPALHWGINEDPRWLEYDHARRLVEAR